MISRSHLLVVFVMTLFVSGCSGMVPLHEVDESHFVDRSLTEDQVKEAIIEGAETAGWLAKDLGGGYDPRNLSYPKSYDSRRNKLHRYLLRYSLQIQQRNEDVLYAAGQR